MSDIPLLTMLEGLCSPIVPPKKDGAGGKPSPPQRRNPALLSLLQQDQQRLALVPSAGSPCDTVCDLSSVPNLCPAVKSGPDKRSDCSPDRRAESDLDRSRARKIN